MSEGFCCEPVTVIIFFASVQVRVQVRLGNSGPIRLDTLVHITVQFLLDRKLGLALHPAYATLVKFDGNRQVRTQDAALG